MAWPYGDTSTRYALLQLGSQPSSGPSWAWVLLCCWAFRPALFPSLLCQPAVPELSAPLCPLPLRVYRPLEFNLRPPPHRPRILPSLALLLPSAPPLLLLAPREPHFLISFLNKKVKVTVRLKRCS